MKEENNYLVRMQATQRNKCTVAEKALEQTNKYVQELTMIIKDKESQMKEIPHKMSTVINEADENKNE